MSYKSINPFTGVLNKSFDEVSDTQLESVLTNAQSCYEKWRTLSYQERGDRHCLPLSQLPKRGAGRKGREALVEDNKTAMMSIGKGILAWFRSPATMKFVKVR